MLTLKVLSQHLSNVAHTAAEARISQNINHRPGRVRDFDLCQASPNPLRTEHHRFLDAPQLNRLALKDDGASSNAPHG